MGQVNSPGFAAETKMVKMGSDSGQLVFLPDEIKICKGDSVTWINNKGGPHNVVFDAEAVPSGVDAESISMDDQLGDEGATYTKKFDTAGTYGYYCEPHAGAGMKAQLTWSELECAPPGTVGTYWSCSREVWRPGSQGRVILGLW